MLYEHRFYVSFPEKDEHCNHLKGEVYNYIKNKLTILRWYGTLDDINVDKEHYNQNTPIGSIEPKICFKG